MGLGLAKKNSFRKLMLQLHLWIGLGAALFLILAGGSGALLVFETQIDRALNGAYLAPPQGEGLALAVDQYTGKALGAWNDDRFTRKLHQFHTHLLAGEIGSAIVAWSSVILLFLSISGLILWWRVKAFGVNFQTSGPKFQYDLHSTIGIASSAVLLAFALTGIVVHWGDTARKWASKVSHVRASQPQQPDPTPPGAKPLEPAQLLSLAQTAAPGARVTTLELADRDGHSAMAIMKFPEDHTPAGRTRVLLDAYSGKVLDLTSSREAPVAMAYVTRINREIHTGDLGGWPARIDFGNTDPPALRHLPLRPSS